METLFFLALTAVMLGIASKLTSPFNKGMNGFSVAHANTGNNFFRWQNNSSKPQSKWSKFKNDFALWSPGFGVGTISGKVGGGVFNQGGSAGAFLRKMVIPKNTRTAEQTAARGRLASISSAWKALTTVQISAWNTLAKSSESIGARKNRLGVVRRMSGSQLFQKVNNYRLLTGLAITPTAPSSGTIDSLITYPASGSAGAQTLTIAITTYAGATTIAVNQKVLVYATSQVSRGINYFGKSSSRFLIAYSSGTALNPLDISAAYIAKFGALVQGKNVSIGLKYMNASGTTFNIGGEITQVITIGA